MDSQRIKISILIHSICQNLDNNKNRSHYYNYNKDVRAVHDATLFDGIVTKGNVQRAVDVSAAPKNKRREDKPGVARKYGWDAWTRQSDREI